MAFGYLTPMNFICSYKVKYSLEVTVESRSWLTKGASVLCIQRCPCVRGAEAPDSFPVLSGRHRWRLPHLFWSWAQCAAVPHAILQNTLIDYIF